MRKRSFERETRISARSPQLRAGWGEAWPISQAWRNVIVESAKSLRLILSALFPNVDPLGGGPIFLALTREYSPATRNALSWRWELLWV